MSINTNIKMVIFDWAGTIIDFGCQAPLKAFQAAFNELGIKVTSLDILQFMGLEKMDHIKKILQLSHIKEQYDSHHLSDLSTKIYEHFKQQLVEQIPKHSDFTPGYIQLIRYLSDNNIKIGSTTGYNRETINQIISTIPESDRKYLPDIMVTSDEVNNSRPAPDMINSNLSKLGNTIKPQNILKVGDTIADIAEGIAAGCQTVAVIDSSSSMGIDHESFTNLFDTDKNNRRTAITKEFKAAGVHYIINNLFELPKLINKLS